MMYGATHSEPNVPTLAASAARVRAVSPRWAAEAHPAAALTARVDKASPLKERTQKRPISASRERRPLLPQTHRRLSSKDGTVPTPVATTLAHPADRDLVAT